MDSWRLLPCTVNDAAMNMAIDEAILSARIAQKVPNTIRLYRWQPSAISVGRNQNPKTEVYLDNTKLLGVDVVRRISGGGTVYHDKEGEVTYAVIAQTSDLGTTDITTIYTKIYSAVRDALRILGTGTDFSAGDPKNCPNLTIDGKKISGSSQIISRGVVLQHGTLLCSVNLHRMFQLLQLKGVSCTQAADIAKRKITSLQDELGHKISPDTVANALEQGFRIMLRIQLDIGELSEEEKETANKLYKEKYTKEEWTLGGKPA